MRVLLLVLSALLLTGCAGRPAAPQQRSPGGCPAPTDPASTACRITEGERVVRDPAATAEALAAAGRLTQDSYRTLGDHPDWDAAVLGSLDPGLREHVTHAVGAYRELVALAGTPGPNLPAWRIVDPLPADQLRGYYEEASRRFGVRWTVLAAVNLVETRMGRIVGLSSAGAQGPMQFMPATWAAYGMGGDVWNPRDAILGAANYLSRNGGAREATLDRALRRYNNDVRYVRAVRHYAAMMDAEPRVYLGLHAWPVVFRTTAGDIPLETGYVSPRPIPVAQWLAENPPPR